MLLTCRHPRLPYSATVRPALPYDLTQVHIDRDGRRTIIECNADESITMIWAGEALYLWGGFLGGRSAGNAYLLNIGALGTRQDGLSGTTCIAASHTDESLLVCDGINIGRVVRGNVEPLTAAPYGKWRSIAEPSPGLVMLSGLIVKGGDARTIIRDETLFYDTGADYWYYGEPSGKPDVEIDNQWTKPEINITR